MPPPPLGPPRPGLLPGQKATGGERMSKRARERKHEEEKAAKALGLGTMREVEGEDVTSSIPTAKHFEIELQWFKLKRGAQRMEQIARILVELAPDKVFDPRDIYSKHLKEEKAAKAAALAEKRVNSNSDKKRSGGKKKGGQKKMSKKDEIIARNKAAQAAKAAKRDAEKLSTLGAKAKSDVKLATESGKLLLLLQILKESVKRKNVVDALDTLWEIEDVYANEIAGEDAKKAAAHAMRKHSDFLETAKEFRTPAAARLRRHASLRFGDAADSLVTYQLTEMSDRLPPLNLHSLSGKFKLDPWQLQVIRLIERRRSVLITAPTSSGKTVLSTFVCTSGARALFVVPTEPLAWQVAAMLRALKLDVSLVVPTLTLVQPKWDVVVGTPHALESALTKRIGFDFDYAVFDEVHSLNNFDGAALQRLIRAIPPTCKVLALSATIGNAPDLAKWWESILEEERESEDDDDDDDDGRAKKTPQKLLHLVVHKARFINLQRHVWTGNNSKLLKDESGSKRRARNQIELSIDADVAPDAPTEPTFADAPAVEKKKKKKLEDFDAAAAAEEAPVVAAVAATPAAAARPDEKDMPEAMKGLHLLHPCACLNNDFLAKNGFGGTDMAFTPVDTYRLYLALKKHVGEDHTVDVAPEKFFGNDVHERITLAQANDYETVLKTRLEKLAKEFPERTRDVLLELSPNVGLPKEFESQDSWRKSIEKCTEELMARSSEADGVASLTDLVFDLKEKKHTPAIVFQLDSVRAQIFFDGLLSEIEAREEFAYPDYRANLIRQAKMAERSTKQTEKGQRKNEDDEDIMEAQEFGETGGKMIDVDAPHPDFSLTPPGTGMGRTEADDVQAKLKDDLPMSGDVAHPLIRALRRGIGVYIEGLPSTYHRVVQAFAQKGRLGVVFSDELLAYGVNMPFRTAAFFGDPGEKWLTPLLHQQMAGRAGRRGLDRQGHLVYAGFSPERLSELLRGELPAVVGRFPLYPTIPLQLIMNERFESGGAQLTREKMQSMCGTPLQEFLNGQTVDGYYDTAEKWVDVLGVLKHPKSSYSFLVPELVWELRQNLPESIALQYILESFITEYKTKKFVDRGSDDVAHQTAIMLLFCRIISRKPVLQDESTFKALGPQGEKQFFSEALPSPHNKDAQFEFWTTLLNESQERIQDSNLPFKEQLLLPVAMDEPLDNQCYAAFIRNQIDPSMPTPMQHSLRQRLWMIGDVLLTCSNVLNRSPELTKVQGLIAKTFRRIRYILDETFQRNWEN